MTQTDYSAILSQAPRVLAFSRLARQHRPNRPEIRNMISPSIFNQLTTAQRLPTTRYLSPNNSRAFRTNIVPKAEPDDKGMSSDDLAFRSGLISAGLATIATISFLAPQFREPFEDLLQDSNDFIGLGFGEALGAGLWSAALYFASPIQLLLLFFGKIETERPSDWLLRGIGIAAGLNVNDLGYTAPQWIRLTVVAICIFEGLLVSTLLSSSLGDSTWAISSGLGACFAAGVYEVGRPRRIEKDEAITLEAQWGDFNQWASTRLTKRGSCHESEVFSAFRKENSRYRSDTVISDEILRDMIRNWVRRSNEGASMDRTPRGFIKGLSVLSRSDPFTGERMGVEPIAKRSVTLSEEAEVIKETNSAL